ncbi:MAG: hypothetical protein K8J31_05460, partial [Anaerolineae bacterium]|nr:hypothetical protein [Anaerolineae bacterium]
PYYYEALALLGAGEADTALDRLSEAERRLGEARDPEFKPLIDTGFAQAHLQIAREAFASRNTSLALDELDATELRAKQAIDADPRLVVAYVTLARRYELEDQYRDALKVVNDALDIPELKADTNLLVERGEIYYQQDELDLAAQDAYTVLYIDPTIEQAYLLQIKVALDQDNPGLAVIYAQNYLFFYPGSAEGYRLLGDARRAEGNVDLALAAYDQALAPTTPTAATVPALIARANISMLQRRYDLARQDYSRAFDLGGDPEIQAKRMEAAYRAGNLSVAQADAADLMGAGVVPDSQLDLMRARILVDESDANDTDALTEALDLLQTASNAVQADLRPVAGEYRARAQYLMGEYDAALRSINDALANTETGSRHFLRGQILEALEEPQQAVREYEWVLMWSEVYPYPFLPDARRRLRLLQEA